MFTAAFAKASLERAIKTFCQALVALLIADGTTLLTTDWGDRCAVAGMAALISILTSIGSGIATDGGPSLVDAEKLTPAKPATNGLLGQVDLGD